MLPMQMEQTMRQHKASLLSQSDVTSAGKPAVSMTYSTVTLAGVLNALDGLHAGQPLHLQPQPLSPTHKPTP